MNVLQDNRKIMHDINILRNNPQETFIMCVEYSHSYITEFLEKMSENMIYITDYIQQIVGRLRYFYLNSTKLYI